MDSREPERGLDRFPDAGPEPEAGQLAKESLLVRLIVGQTIGATLLTVMVVIGGLMIPGSGLLALTPLGAIAVVVGVASYWLLRRGRFRLGGYVFLMGTSVAITVTVFVRGYEDASALYYLWPVLGGMLLMEARDGLVVAVLSALSYLALVATERLGYQTPLLPYDAEREALLTVGSRMVVFCLLAFLAWLSSHNLNRAIEQARRAARRWRELNETLDQRVAERTRGLHAAVEVGRATTSVLDPDELLRQVVELVRERFGLYYVGLFLMDEERRFAVLGAGTGEAGRQMIVQGHRLAVGGESMIGQCVAGGQARIALDVGAEAVRFDNPLLPETRSEMALPLRSRGRVIGAMTVQSAERAAFDEADVAVMQTMADQVGVAIDNARLFAQTQAVLEEMEATQRHYLGQEWVRYLRSAETTSYEMCREGTARLGDAVVPEVRRAVARRSPVAVGAGGDGGEGHSSLVVPISVRGVVVGALGIHDEEGARDWTEDEIALAEAVSERMALAAESLRLFEETRRRAARERLISEITDKLHRAADMDTLMRVTAREAAAALGVPGAFVQWARKPGDGGEQASPAGPVETERRRSGEA